MTSDEFRSLVRGDLICIGGTGRCVVEAVYYQSGMVKINIRPQLDDEIIEGIPETEAFIVDQITPITILQKVA